MTEFQLRQKVADMTRSYIGCKESNGTHKPIIDLYNSIRPLPCGYKMKYTDPWCAAFVSVVFANCELLSIAPAECGCDRMIALYKKLGRWVEDDAYKAKVGDVIFYDWEDSGRGDNVGSPDHVGVVVDVKGDRMEIIEGNKSDSVSRRYMNYNAKNIRGFGAPDYATVAKNATVATDTNVGSNQPEIPVEDGIDTTATEKLPILRKGDTGEVVRAAQMLLNGRDCYVGRYGCDGEFGNDTLSAVLAFQRRNGLAADGEIGAQTWATLLGLR